MQTMEQIAEALGTEQTALRCMSFGEGNANEQMIRLRREFVGRAFAAGHEAEEIMQFIQRTPVMLQHALRMYCVERLRTAYELSLRDIADLLRRAA